MSPSTRCPGVLDAIAPHLSDNALVGTLDDLEAGFLRDVVQAIAPYLSEPARARLLGAAEGLDEIDRFSRAAATRFMRTAQPARPRHSTASSRSIVPARRGSTGVCTNFAVRGSHTPDSNI